MVEYSEDIKEQQMDYVSDDIVLCHRNLMPNCINSYVLCRNVQVLKTSEPEDMWLSSGSWYLGKDNRYHSEFKKETPSSIKELVALIRERG